MEQGQLPALPLCPRGPSAVFLDLGGGCHKGWPVCQSLGQHPAVHSCYSCLWESLSQFTCLKQWQTVEVTFSCIKALNPLRHLVIWPLHHNQVLMTLITNATASCNFYKSGTCLSPQKRVDVAWGKLERDRWGSGLLGVGGRKLLGGHEDRLC